MKLETQKKWGQPLDYSPDFYAIEEHEEDHIEKQYIEMWSTLWKLCKVPLMCGFCLVVISGWALWI